MRGKRGKKEKKGEKVAGKREKAGRGNDGGKVARGVEHFANYWLSA